ncbi:THO complex subunit 4B [Citrus sinensis]|uniref:THO complex subunit 4B n=1 Tax=Citrus sinensis TaxID=2711 RepID=A0ACB8L2V3_CITSI|nr:THO complex subunit 4B [Citrus sinensis]
MSNPLDMTLDEIIRNKKRSRGQNSHFRGSNTGSGGTGPQRRAPPNHDRTGTAPYRPVKQNAMKAPVQVSTEAIKTQPSKMAARGGISTYGGTRLYISNLHYGVSDEDIEMLFSSVGELKTRAIHYDRSGRSKGTAEVSYFRQVDAQAAMKRFNNAHLDGKPLKIEFVGVQLVAPRPVPPTKNSIVGNPNVLFTSGASRVGAGERLRGDAFSAGGSRGLASGGGNGNHHEKKLAAEDLDADLDQYLLEARSKK